MMSEIVTVKDMRKTLSMYRKQLHSYVTLRRAGMLAITPATSSSKPMSQTRVDYQKSL